MIKFADVASGTPVFDEIWAAFHEEMRNDPSPDFDAMFDRQSDKAKLVVALGKLNYQVENGGFAQWIDNGYADATGDYLLHKLTSDNHEYPLLSLVHSLLAKVLQAIDSHLGGETFVEASEAWKDPDEDDLFEAFRGDGYEWKGVQDPDDLETVTVGGETFDVTDETLEDFDTRISDLEDRITALEEEQPEDESQPTEEIKDLQEEKEELEMARDMADGRKSLVEKWYAFKEGGYKDFILKEFGVLEAQYYDRVTLESLCAECAMLVKNFHLDEIIETPGEEVSDATFNGEPEPVSAEPPPATPTLQETLQEIPKDVLDKIPTDMLQRYIEERMGKNSG